MVAELEHVAADETTAPQNAPHPFLFDVETYHKLGEAGILHPEARTELIEGEIVMMSPIGKKHAARVTRLNNVFSRLAGEKYIVSVQNPLLLPGNKNEPQPDVMLLKPREDFYEAEQPQAADVLLLIEVSDTTLAYDRKIKLPLYARFDVPEVWIVNLTENIIEIHTAPKNGEYTLRRLANRGEQIAPQAFPELQFAVESIVG